MSAGRAAGRYAVNAADVVCLSSPSDFFGHLMSSAQSVRRRVSVASLYVGNGEKETALVDALASQVAANPALEVRVCVDGARGARVMPPSAASPACSSADVLRSIVDRAGTATADRVRVGLLRLPQHDSVLGRALPPRWSEGVGVQHMKLFVFDDDVLVTGANVSDEYFTTRQDRYVVIRNAGRLADDAHAFVDALTRHSHTVGGNGHTVLEPPQRDAVSLKRLLDTAFTTADADTKTTAGGSQSDASTTTITPVLQFKPMGVTRDMEATMSVLSHLSSSNVLHMASGYFNFPRAYTTALLASPPGTAVHILTASPSTNGFHSASGMSSGIPLGYSEIEKRFYNAVSDAGRAGDIHLHEYVRDGWTFHGKGLWLSVDESAVGPHVTFVGSPNFGRRSVERDVELQFMIHTSDEDLQRRLAAERDALFAGTDPVTSELWSRPDRQIGGLQWKNGAWLHFGSVLFEPFL